MRQIKEKLQDKTGVAVEEQSLSIRHLGKELLDGRIMSDYNIHQNMSLKLTVRIPFDGAGTLIEIQLSTGHIIRHKVNLADTFQDLKAGIANDLDIPTTRQRMSYQGKVFRDGETISEYHRVAQSPLRLQFTMTVQVEHGEAVEIVPFSTVKSIKKGVAMTCGIDTRQQTVLCNGKVLEDESTLAEYGIVFGDTVTVSLYAAAAQESVLMDMTRKRLPIVQQQRKLEAFLSE